MAAPVPQLRMRRNLDNLPEVVLPDGYELRSLTTTDLAAWTQLLGDNAELGRWTIERATPFFAPGAPVILDGSYFITKDSRPIATAQLDLPAGAPFTPLAELGWVAVRPEHRGHGLGYVVCLAVLRAAAARGFPGIYLNTDDFRLPAIQTYLKLGFEPWLLDPTSPERWRLVREQLEGYQAAGPPFS
jgi:mycothiol synthase